jgi:hypothetical protein
MTTMRKTGRRTAVVVFGVALAALMAIPGAGEAQSMRLSGELEKARSHEAEAHEQMESRARWDRAAWNFRRAANLRATGDPVAVENFAMAGRLSYYLQDHSQAMRDMENAAAHALSAGDIVAAANYLMDAAWLAARDGRREQAEVLAGRAGLLAGAPAFGESSRGEILARLDRAGIEAPTFSRTAGR